MQRPPTRRCDARLHVGPFVSLSQGRGDGAGAPSPGLGTGTPLRRFHLSPFHPRVHPAAPLVRRRPFPFAKGAEEGIRVFVTEEAGHFAELERGL
jgi:hypothetical protein